MLAIHPQARTTPAGCAEIARSPESSAVLAKRYGVSAETVCKWFKRGPDARQDRSAGHRKLAWRANGMIERCNDRVQRGLGIAF